MNVGDQHYHVALQIQPIPDEKVEEIKEGLQQSGQQQGDDSE